MMENLINDLLDLAKLENNSFSLSLDYFSLSSTIYQALNMLLFNAKKLDINLRAEIDKSCHMDLISSIHGDQRRYLQILLNFLSNSLKFTDPKGTVSISVAVVDHQIIKQRRDATRVKKHKVLGGLESCMSISKEDYISFERVASIADLQDMLQNHMTKRSSARQLHDSGSFRDTISNLHENDELFIDLEIRVIDTGVGISPEGLSKLFIDFSRLKENSSRNKSGTGLGLSICK